MTFPSHPPPVQVLGKRPRGDSDASTLVKKRKDSSYVTSYPTPESTQPSSTESASEETSKSSATNTRTRFHEILPDNYTINAVRAKFLAVIDNYLPLGSLNVRLSAEGEAILIHEIDWIELGRGPWIERNFREWATKLAGIDWIWICAMKHIDFSEPFTRLAESGWIRIFAKKHQTNQDMATLRIYALPDDVGRRYVDRHALRGISNLRGYLEQLINKLDISPESWEGRNHNANETEHYDTESKIDDSLFYLFNTLPSPRPCPSTVSCPISNEALHSVFESARLPGVMTPLYPYQKRTIATMIKREVEPERALDPRFQPLKGPTGQVFYYDKVAIVLLRDRREYDEARGGILGESMGLGKTLICLATILATKGHWPDIPPEYSVDLRPVRPKVGSLMQMAAAAVGRAQVPWRALFQDFSRVGDQDHQNCVEILEANIGSYVVPLPETKYSQRRTSVVSKGKMIRLSTATLIIAPQNLLSQWKSEISTHIEDDYLKILYLDSGNKTPMPCSDELLPYDVILMSRQRFEKEMAPSERMKASSKVKRARDGCLCSLDDDCHCSKSDEYQTPLKDLHFLRIIMDEGHEFSSSGRAGTAYWALRNLHVDRKWIVSGTPANGLLGVEVGTATYETSETLDNGNNKSNWEVLEARRKESGLTQERKDLEKLGILACGFLRVKPWSNGKEDDPASWQKYIMPHLDGRRKARSLKTLLESLVVRHRIEDIEADIQLPPLHNRVMYLEPSWYDKLSINMFILSLTANAVTSERVDEDYMFHNKTRRQLNILINNLRQSGFYWTGFSPGEIAKTIKVSCAYLEEHADTAKYADQVLLERAVGVGELVLDSASWRSFAELHEMGVFVEGFPKDARGAWSLVPGQESDLLLTGATQLAKAQNWVDKHLYASNPSQGLADVGTTTMQKLWQFSQSGAEQVTSGDPAVEQEPMQRTSPRSRDVSTGVPKLTSERTVSRAKTAPAPRRIQKVENLHHPPPNDASKPAGLKPALKSALKTSSAKAPVDLLPSDSLLAQSKLYGTASAKLSYLLDRVIVLHESEKTLIFYEGDHIAWYIAQALDLVDIRYLIYTKSLSQVRQTAYITTFNTTETFRVLLMNVHQAAHGLHIASASRVFFVNPVWQPNVEAQAIKRAHRIGQTRPVYVETLVLKDTLEDQMLRRRKCMTPQEHQKAERSLLDDDTMSTIIKNAQFLPLPEEETHDMNKQVARLQLPQQIFARVGKGEGDFHDPDADLIFPDNAPTSKKQRRNQKRRESVRQATRSPTRTPLPAPNRRHMDEPSKISFSNTNEGEGSAPGPSRRVGFDLGGSDTEPRSLFGGGPFD